MEYRKLPRDEEKLSVIGLGSGSLGRKVKCYWLREWFIRTSKRRRN